MLASRLITRAKDADTLAAIFRCFVACSLIRLLLFSSPLLALHYCRRHYGVSLDADFHISPCYE